MTLWQQLFVSLYALYAFGAFFRGVSEVIKKKNAFGLATLFGSLGIFVWGDAIVLGPFWLLTSLLVLFLQDWQLFLVILSLFWVVRSLGEVIYWITEQFSKEHRNPPETLMLYRYFKSDAVWFVYQVYWQCILVLSLLASVYAISNWLS
jgi:hypothetical protein